MNGKGMRSRRVIPAIMLPCNFCDKKRALYETADDISEAESLEERCRKICDDFSYFKKYGINSKVPASVEETDYLLEITNLLLDRIEKSGINDDDVARLEVASERLAFVINLEEARLDAAKSTTRASELLIKGAAGDI